MLNLRDSILRRQQTMSHQADHDNVFDELVRIFATRDKHSQILEIEILPSSLGLGPVVHDGCSVGITKKALVQAFVVARQVFWKVQSSQDEQFYNDESVLRASEINLLFAPEHITACNWRKRRLTWILHDTSRPQGIDTTAILDRELTLVTSFFCSPLHRHTKSPNLWQHRFWVLCRILETRGWDISGHCAIIQQKEDVRSILQSELSIVLRAGELHPRNYYAFSYMRQLHALLLPPGLESEDLSTALLDQTISWCLAHPRDISSWVFAYYLVGAIPNRRDVQTRIINQVVRFALDIGWTGESLWTFVDMTVQRVGVVDGDLENLAGNVHLPETSWKTWLARAETYWAAGVQPQET